MLHQDCFKEFDQTSSILIRFLHGITKMSQKFRPASRGAFPEGYYENPGSEAALRRSRANGESIAYTLRGGLGGGGFLPTVQAFFVGGGGEILCQADSEQT